LNEAVQQVTPLTALSVGLKVDSDAVPAEILASADLNDPATTAALLRLDAVVGVRAEVAEDGSIVRLGITCALCHSTVDNSVTSGVGRRLDGWPNRDLNVGAIVALSPALDDATKAVLGTWGAGRYDAYLSHDGESSPVMLPPAYGLRDVAPETYTGEGGEAIFRGAADCARCHIPDREFTDAGIRLHAPAETGMDPLRAQRGTTGAYRSTPLRGAWQRPPYFHDRSAPTLLDVVEHYDSTLNLNLTAQQKSDLAVFLSSL
jgi:cytochrome c2